MYVKFILVKNKFCFSYFASIHCMKAEYFHITLIITRLIGIDIAPLTVLFCNCPPLKDISFNTKCLLVWCD